MLLSSYDVAFFVVDFSHITLPCHHTQQVCGLGVQPTLVIGCAGMWALETHHLIEEYGKCLLCHLWAEQIRRAKTWKDERCGHQAREPRTDRSRDGCITVRNQSFDLKQYSPGQCSSFVGALPCKLKGGGFTSGLAHMPGLQVWP